MDKNRKLLNVMKICEDYQTGGLNWGWFGRATTNQLKKTVQQVHVATPDIDWCIRTKTWLAYDEDRKLLHVSDNLKYGTNHWIGTLVDDVKNARVDIRKYYVESPIE